MDNDEIEALLRELSGDHSDYANHHRSILMRHLEKHASLKRKAARDETWAKIEREAYLLRKWRDNALNRAIEDGGNSVQ